MSPMGKHICRYLVCDPGEEPVRPDWAYSNNHPVWTKNQGADPNAAHVGAKVDNPFAMVGTSSNANAKL